jgi:blocked-early-in-transport protein 1
MYSSSSNPYDLESGRRRGGGGLSASDANANILEQQNNERIDELSSHVSRLKGLTIDINNEVREQNSLLDNMGDGFTNTRDKLQGSLRRIGTMLEQGGAKHMCYMVGFCVAVMLFLWWLMSHKGTRGV